MAEVDLTHHYYTFGKIGRVLPKMMVPVLPGDVIDIQSQTNIVFSAYTREVALDARVDTVAFYIPMRHIYPDDWVQLVEEGIDSAVTLSTDTMGSVNWTFLPHWSDLPTSKPSWYADPYLMIYNRFFKPKNEYIAGQNDWSWTNSPLSTAFTDDDKAYGFPAANLPTALWNQTPNKQLAASDLAIDTTGNTFDLNEIEEAQAKAVSEMKRDWTMYFYEDILDERQGQSTIDAEPRPEKLWQDTQYIGGENVRGTSDHSLGAITGRQGGTVQFNVPNRYIPEWGIVMVMEVIRFPYISTEETMYQMRQGAGDYELLVADPLIMASKRPQELQVADCFDSTDTSVLAQIPNGHWWRQHPSYARPEFQQRFGFTFAQGIPPTADAGENYYDTSVDDENFTGTMLGHYRSFSKHNIFCRRMIPEAEASLYTGLKY